MPDFNDADMILVGIGEEFENNELALRAYNQLETSIRKKNYFILSLCMDDVIYNSNLDKGRIVTPLGGKLKKQCPDACSDDLFEISETVCPHCGKELVFNNYLAENYVEAGYLPQWNKYKTWLGGTLNRRLYLLELGVSLKLPQIIRFPFEKLTSLNNKATLFRVNGTMPQVPAEISDKCESIKVNAVDWVLML